MPLAPRALRSRIGLHVRPMGRRRTRLRRARTRRRRVRDCARACGSRGASPDSVAQRPRGRHFARDRQVGARVARLGRSGFGDRAHRRGVRRPLSKLGLGCGPHRARRDGQPLPAPRRRATRAIRHRASLSARSRPTTYLSIASKAGTGASSTLAPPTPPSARSKPHSPSRIASPRSRT